MGNKLTVHSSKKLESLEAIKLEGQEARRLGGK
jgi:hypothetical protein